MKKEKIINIPNALSFYRLIVFPLIFFFAYSANEKYFAIFLCLNLVTDVLDGFIARRFNMVTKLGASLDNLGDLGTYLLSIYGIYKFKLHLIKDHTGLLIIFFAVLLVTVLISLIKFRKMPGLHLYSCVLAGYIQGVFFFVLFV
ncbi:MAG: CDP-alcohol phosphatidyltransferase family protein, partial [Bacteroidia bacterium]|nr:CDP-alcohol phosphatidyltransferase family protein [Bacteroidia bacterium]